MTLYNPLISDEKHLEIRICTLLPRRQTDDPILCKLETADLLDSQIDYEALSYAWGSSENKATITINGSPFQVTQNLHTALQYLSYESKPRALWIDAICINQSDVNERNSQVRSMGRIYSAATRVISWLGLEDPPINYVESMEEAKLMIQMVRSLPANEFFEQLINGPNKEDLRDIFERGLYFLQLIIGERKYRPSYWQRAWIVQEVCLGQSWILQAGALSISEDDISAVTTMLQHPQAKAVMQRKYHERRLRAVVSLDSFLSVSIYRSLLPTCGTTTALPAPRTRGSWPLLSLLRHSRSRLCADPKDKLYSVLAVSDMKDNKSEYLKIDYTRSTSQIYTDSVKAIIKTHSSLEVLSYVNAADRIGSSIPDLPSWVPDWSAHKEPIVADRPVSYGLQCAMGTSPAQVKFLERSGKEILVAKGIVFGTVVGLRDPIVNIDAIRMKGESEVAKKEYLSLYHQLPLAYKQLSQATHPQRLSPDSFRRTCSFGLLKYEIDDPFQELVDDLKLESETESNTPPTTTKAGFTKGFGFRYRTMASDMVNRSIFAIKPNQTKIPHRQLAWEVGIGEAAAVKESDLVCLLQGCGTPLILRPMGSQHVLVCAAYVDSLMAGFGHDCMREGLFDAEEFHLI